MTKQFRKAVPSRTCSITYKNYRNYKNILASDFNRRCGYCDDFDGWSGGIDAYHIDHFAPRKKFPQLETCYENLIYSCPYCNRYKSDDWPSDSPVINTVANVGYINPCTTDYDNHFSRTTDGGIIANTEVGQYMYRKLKLYLIRHKIIWSLTQLHYAINDLQSIISKDTNDTHDVKEHIFELSQEFHRYLDYFFGVTKNE